MPIFPNICGTTDEENSDNFNTILVILATSCFAASIRSSVQAAPTSLTGEIRIALDGTVQGTDMLARDYCCNS
jgi:hypothetical protein